MPSFTRIDFMVEWNASDYEKNFSGQERAAEAVISGLVLEGHEHILDIGCGDGKVTAKLAARVPHGQILGIDSSQGMIDFARLRFPLTQYSNLRFEQGDAQNFRYNQEFDLAASFASLHWGQGSSGRAQGHKAQPQARRQDGHSVRWQRYG
jgi:trans-aconitate 2-methyltransferase